jgi:iron complex outermembrane receptor protein
MQPGMPGMPSALLAPGMASSLTGIDMEFEVGFSTDHAGDMIIGLQLTRVLDAQFQNGQAPMLGISNWNITEPMDSARLSFDWSQGPFSGGIQSYYQTPVDFLNRSSLDSYATFDVYFSWRAPWNASVSVGASNVMNAGKKEGNTGDNQLVDPFESIYGRIPYVRYKQDL